MPNARHDEVKMPPRHGSRASEHLADMEISSNLGRKSEGSRVVSSFKRLEATMARSPLEARGLGPPLLVYLLSPLLAPLGGWEGCLSEGPWGLKKSLLNVF